jgi:hypothetical protein
VRLFRRLRRQRTDNGMRYHALLYHDQQRRLLMILECKFLECQ